MTVSIPEDRFRELGMTVPDLSFLRKPIPPSEQWGRESLYNTRALVGNWYEDRRAFKLICPRCTGHSITRTDYLTPCKEAYSRSDVIPPPIYARKLQDAGEGPTLLRNTEDYCDYLQNYTTTYDLMHNWEVRRAGCKPKPWRRWKLIRDANWVPDRDNTCSFGNLTQLGYRKAPQLPLLPNDWDVYANNPTTYSNDYIPHRYPEDYIHCRRAASKQIRKENEEMILVKAPEDPVCYKCNDSHLDTKCKDLSCPCICHAVEIALRVPQKRTKVKLPYNQPRFSKTIPASQLHPKPGNQTLHAGDTTFPYRTLKHPPHLPATLCKCSCPIPSSRKPPADGIYPFNRPDNCNDFAGDSCRE